MQCIQSAHEGAVSCLLQISPSQTKRSSVCVWSGILSHLRNMFKLVGSDDSSVCSWDTPLVTHFLDQQHILPRNAVCIVCNKAVSPKDYSCRSM